AAVLADPTKRARRSHVQFRGARRAAQGDRARHPNSQLRSSAFANRSGCAQGSFLAGVEERSRAQPAMPATRRAKHVPRAAAKRRARRMRASRKKGSPARVRVRPERKMIGTGGYGSPIADWGSSTMSLAMRSDEAQ